MIEENTLQECADSTVHAKISFNIIIFLIVKMLDIFCVCVCIYIYSG